MIVCISCKSETKEKMDLLMKKDNYRDYSEIIALAVDNLWILRQEITEKGSLVIGESHPESPASSPVKNVKPRTCKRAASSLNLQSKNFKPAFTTALSTPVRIPDLFLNVGLDRLIAATIKIPISGESEKTFTLDRWLFGQYNKLLPIKANCRALLRITAEHPDGVALKEVAPRIGEAAALLGDYLADHDCRHRIGRDDALATAFPRSDPDAAKSRARYTNQFVGSINSQGALSGLLWDYGLAALAPDSGDCLMLTEPAIRFAHLMNPVLDNCQTHPAQKFSSEEAAFILDHIRAHVPVEAFAFRTLTQAITAGASTPDLLDEALRIYVPAEANRSLSASFLSSQRSGALSRMADLGLIARERNGVRVSYIVTEQGQRLIESK